MTRTMTWLLPAGLLLFVGILASQGAAAVFSTLALAKWGLLLVALFHLLPLVLDAAAIQVLLDAAAARSSWLTSLLARWVGETVSELRPKDTALSEAEQYRLAALVRGDAAAKHVANDTELFGVPTRRGVEQLPQSGLRNLIDLGVAARVAADDGRPAGDLRHVPGELPRSVDGHPLRVVAGLIHDFDVAGDDDEKLGFAVAGAEQRFAIADFLARGKRTLTHIGQAFIVKFWKRDRVRR